MSRLTDLIHQAKSLDPQLGLDLDTEFRALLKRRSFGLVFERHRPEAVELPQRPVRKGDTVRILPPRGSMEKGDKRLWRVLKIERNNGSRMAHLIEVGKDLPERSSVTLEDVVVVAAFRDPLYPGLAETGRIERGGDKPFHTVINGENYHVLEMLTYTHRHKVDAIYIDPPYNSGAKDWKYNNDYVESDDLYRHSKWLAMMERRLTLAKELLNPENSVLIVTIDEKEYLRLGLLLEQILPEARIQMISTVINPKGVPRDGFARVDEYIFFVQFGSSEIVGDIKEGSGGTEVRWRSLTRTGANGTRSKSPGAFYPIYFDKAGKIIEVGDALPIGKDASSLAPRKGLIAVWPTPRPDGEDGRWSVVSERLREMIEIGAVKVGRVKLDKEQFPIFYLTSEQLAAIESGELEVRGKTPEGVMQVFFREERGRVSAPRTVWEKVSHSASEQGSGLLKTLLPGRKFPYPKSLYAVEDVLRLTVRGKSEAVILDFFSGSGTTAHAVMRLNHEDSGRRQCISITNNEVGADEQTELRRQSLRPGDSDWEQWGICDYITKPRIQAAITGKTPDGQPISGDYRFIDEFPVSEGFKENAVFFTLTYEGALSVSHHRAFERVAPLLWLRAGSIGRIINAIPERGWDVAESYGVLVALDETTAFVKAMSGIETARIAYIVTDDDRRFQMICSLLPEHLTPLRLYESYLANFEINSERCT
ncbi:MAG: DNA methyltransferase [Methanoregula sp.]|nr:DNA methyltransferase [Methanoregula sp.]